MYRSTPPDMNPSRAFSWPFLVCLNLVIAGIAGPISTSLAADLDLKARLVWGTDEAKPKESACKELDDKVKKKLCRIFKWTNYFEISEQRVSLPPGSTKKLKMSPKCELQFKYLDEETVEVRLIGEGIWTKTVKQSIKALRRGELAVLAGDDRDKYNDAWFVVLNAEVPPSPPPATPGAPPRPDAGAPLPKK